MNPRPSRHALLVVGLLSIQFALAGCASDDGAGPAEQTGEQIDETAHEVQEGTAEAIQETGEAIEEGTSATADAVDGDDEDTD